MNTPRSPHLIVWLILWVVTTAMAWGPCRVEQEAKDAQNLMVRHLAGECSEEDRAALAVPADDVLKALKAGQGIDLEGVVLSGDLMFDALPLEPVPSQDHIALFIRERLEREGLQEIRLIKGPLQFRGVEVQGIVASNLVDQGYLLIQGPVMMKGTTFHRSVDFSRTGFLDQVDFSGAIIGYEGFFIQALFAKDAHFEKTAFGTHSRFHKAVFAGKATFTRAGFNGLAEFLEVTFQQETGFSRTRFVQGTGFSGSRFQKILDFSEATFEREAYFRFTQFEDDAYFRRSIFRDTADFTEAKFGGVSDFTKVLFEEPPQLVGVAVSANQNLLKGLQDPRYQIGVFVLLGLFLLFFFFLFRKNEKDREK